MATYTTPNGTVVDEAGAIVNSGSSGSTSTPTPSPTAPNLGSSDFTTQLQQKLLSQSGIISSDSTALESKINEAISGVKKSADASAQVITSQYNREIAATQEKGQNAISSFNEASRGYATNTAALKQLTDDTDKQVKDLEQRKQELILQGQASAAAQVSQMQMEAIKFRQEAQQQVFSNLLGMANFGLQADQQRQQVLQFNRQQSFAENQAISSVALQYGLTVKPGETLEQVVTRAAPFASKKQQLELAKLQSDIAKNNADIRAAQAGSFDGISEAALASAARSNPALLGALATKNPQAALRVQNEINKLEATDVNDTVGVAIQQGKTRQQTIEAITNDPQIWNKGDAISKVNEAFDKVPAKVNTSSGGLPQLVGTGYSGFANNTDAVLSWIFGINPNPPFKQ